MRRFASFLLALGAVVAAPVAAQIPVYDGPEPTAVLPYGDGPLQFGELRMPEGDGPFPVAVTIHGGCWLDRLGEGSITPVAAALTAAGIATWNVEYRRLGHDGGGWPGTFLDVGAGIDHLRELAIEYPIDLDRVALVGHSSGAHLAVWAAGRSALPADSEIRGSSPLPVRAAVGIDGPMDLAAWSEGALDVQVCGEPVIASLIGGDAEAWPIRYEQASPALMPRIDAAIYLNPAGMMLSLGDPDVMSRRAVETGESVEVRPVVGSNHFQLITPEHETWSIVLETIRTALGGATRQVPEPARGTAGMVSSAHPLATEAGLEVLRAGGNAFDATVAVAAALNVVEPMMSGMGGYGTILVYSAADGATSFLNPSGRIPAGVDTDQYRAPTPGYEANRRGAKAVSTPGNVNAWAAMHERFGSLEWSSLLAPAIRLAREGFVLDARTASQVAAAWDEFPAHAREFYGSEGRPLGRGDRLVQADLAGSLELVAREGADAFYRGELAASIDRAMREADGFLRLQDLHDNEAEWWDPIEIDYRGHRVVTASPPANSFPALVRLGLMSRFDVRAMGHNSAEYLHTYAEVTKHAFWTRLAYAGDPEVDPPPLEMLLSESYWEEVARGLSPDEATEFEPPAPRTPDRMQHTTHFVVADGEGNVVSATQTLGNAFGARIMPEGTGIWLNNSLAYSTFEPPGNPMDAHPGRRKLSGDVPLFVLDAQGRPWLAIGTPGGHTIAQTVPQIVMNVLDFGMDIREAIAQPRVSFIEPNRLAVEDRIPESTRAALTALGHDLRLVRRIGNAHGLTVEWGAAGRPTAFAGGADPRGVGLAKGLDALMEDRQ